MSSDFEFMQDTVDAICKSMEEHPYDWRITTYVVSHKDSSVEYWKDDFRTTWNGSHRDVVFSGRQAEQIEKSFDIMKKKMASDAQKQVINSFKSKPSKLSSVEQETSSGNPWWKFW